MKFLPKRKRGEPLSRQLAQASLTDAMGRVQENRSGDHRPFADRCSRVRTAQGRTAHLLPPEGRMVVLCEWPGATFDAGPNLEDCRMCLREAQRRDRLEAAS